jgi:hypothetical protein
MNAQAVWTSHNSVRLVFSRRRQWTMLSSGRWWRRFILVRTTFGQEHIASIFRVKDSPYNGISIIVCMCYCGERLDQPSLRRMSWLASHRRQQCKISCFRGGNNDECYVRFEVFTAVTMKNAVFWGVTSCGSCKNRRFGGTNSISSQRASVAS